MSDLSVTQVRSMLLIMGIDTEMVPMAELEQWLSDMEVRSK